METVQLYIALDSIDNILGMCTDKDILISNLKCIPSYNIRYLEFEQGAFLDGYIADNSTFVDTIINYD